MKFNEYASKQEQVNFENRIEPLLHGCERTLVAYAKDNADVRAAVLSFDEAFSQKASKWQITSLAESTHKEITEVKERHAKMI